MYTNPLISIGYHDTCGVDRGRRGKATSCGSGSRHAPTWPHQASMACEMPRIVSRIGGMVADESSLPAGREAGGFHQRAPRPRCSPRRWQPEYHKPKHLRCQRAFFGATNLEESQFSEVRREAIHAAFPIQPVQREQRMSALIMGVWLELGEAEQLPAVGG